MRMYVCLYVCIIRILVCIYVCMYDSRIWHFLCDRLFTEISRVELVSRTFLKTGNRYERFTRIHASPLSFIYNVYTMNLELKFIHWAIYNSPYVLRPVDDQNGGRFKHPLEYFRSIRSFCSSTRYFCLGDFRSSNNIIYKPSFVSRWAPKVLFTSSRGPYVKHSI